MADRFANPRMLGVQRLASARKWLAASLFLLISALLLSIHPLGPFSLLPAGLCVIGAIFCWHQCSKLHAACERANQGADGEEEVFGVLQALPQGWSVERNVLVHGIGDIDILIKAPE